MRVRVRKGAEGVRRRQKGGVKEVQRGAQSTCRPCFMREVSKRESARRQPPPRKSEVIAPEPTHATVHGIAHGTVCAIVLCVTHGTVHYAACHYRSCRA